MSGVDGSGAVHTVLPWEAFGGHVPFEMAPLDADPSPGASIPNPKQGRSGGARQRGGGSVFFFITLEPRVE